MDKDGVGTVERKAMFMQTERHIDVALDVDELDGASVVRLDYGKSLDDTATVTGKGPPHRMPMTNEDDEAEFSAFFILPAEDRTNGINTVFNKIAELSRPKTSSSLTLENILGDTFRQKIKLFLPRFRLSYGTQSISEQIQ